MTALHAAVAFAFDPIVIAGPLAVRLEALGNAAAIFLALVAAAFFARRTPIDLDRPYDAEGREPGERNHLRRDDLLYIAVAVIPGAFIGGRIGYALVHAEQVGPGLSVLLDLGWGGLQLSLAVVGGVVTGSAVARLLDAPLGRWLHATILPLLFVLGAGKLAMTMGGSGQGQLFDGPLATLYLGPGPWGSLAPELPSHPAQVYEGLATFGVLLLVMALMAAGLFRLRSGGAFLAGLGLWALARAGVAAVWRDPAVVGPLNVDQVISLVIAVVAFALLAVRMVSDRRRTRSGFAAAPDAPDPVGQAG